MTDVLLATSADLPAGEPHGHLLVDAFAARGLAARWVSWRDPAVDWSRAALVAARSTWDYPDHREEFLRWSRHVDQWSTLLHGPAAFRWNTDKAYLLDLEAAGLPVVPTRLLDDRRDLDVVADAFPGACVVKPRVGAGGRGLTVHDPAQALSVAEASVSEGGPWVVQPLVESVRSEGELSVFVIGGKPVTQCRKLPAGDEVRVNEEYGGHTVAEPLSDEAMLLASEAVAAGQQVLGVTLTCARVDAVRMDTGQLVVSELEIVEPGLYLDVLPQNADAYAEAVALVM